MNDRPLQSGENSDAPPGKEQFDAVSRENAQLREKMEEVQRQAASAQLSSALMDRLSARMMDETLALPGNMKEAAVLGGQVSRAATDFREKWKNGAPGQDQAGYEEYTRELDGIATDMAAAMKWLGENGESLRAEAESLATFQSHAFYGALGLNETQWNSVHAELLKGYQDALGQNLLDRQNRTAANAAQWDEQRAQLGERIYREVGQHLTAPQRAELGRIYGPGAIWNLQIGSK